jgi:hypothetical protein
MKRLIAPLAVAAVALAPGVAQAHSRAKVYRGTFDLVGADGDYVNGHFGRAHLVDGPRRDHLSVHVRRLGSGARFLFRLQQSPVKACAEDAPGGTDVRRWHYRRGGVLRTNRRGVANGSARSHRFRARRGVAYFVGVYTLGPGRTRGELVLCADLRTKKKGGKGKDEGRGKARGKDRARSKAKRDDSPGRSGEAPGQTGETPGRSGEAPGRSGEAPGQSGDAPGRSGEAPGRADDKQRGKSGDKPRGKSARRRAAH